MSSYWDGNYIFGQYSSEKWRHESVPSKTPRIGLYEASKGLRIGPSYRPRLPV
ncbi:hypothetical protein HanXRQr2_Chr17g0800961 [Helianthus annuus]|uniref:Uncharacterized protein n=1 Tax=Helianthus annuus TaxID=4232 RepID=A0A9K3GV10_HELAN|nr:hypothetical protein HanXRQr2_Chr17g0800961 [Helianthus annuus]KAJ0813005.1 hypothetical protein HanPSC8_Chr17g0768561 [Helianthus annuus]